MKRRGAPAADAWSVTVTRCIAPSADSLTADAPDGMAAVAPPPVLEAMVVQLFVASVPETSTA